MSIFSNVINELKRVPTDVEPEEYEKIDNEDDEPVEDESSDDNYELPDDEPDESGNQTEEPEDPAADEGDDNYDLDQADSEDDLADEGDPAPDEPETEDEYDELQQLEDDVFKDLKDDEKAIRDKELLKLYVNMYNDIENTLGRINNIPKTERILQPLTYCSKKLTEVRGILYEYILSSYKIKTYIENMSNYYEFLAVLQAINKIFSEISEKEEDKD